MLPTQDTNHVAEGLALRTGRYLSKANMAALLTAFLNRVQDVENVLWDVIESQLLARVFPASVGVPAQGTLDGPPDQALLFTADLVGAPAGTWTTRQLVFLVQIWILARKSQARTVDILGILSAAAAYFAASGFTGGFTYQEQYPAAFEASGLNVPDYRLVAPLAQAIAIARPPGVDAVLAWSDWSPATTFSFGGGTCAGSGFAGGTVAPAPGLLVGQTT
jgi:hypothetical protein